MVDYSLKKYPIIGACGLVCGLCPRYYTDGSSKCPGCGGPGFSEKHPSCGFLTCCIKKKGLESCGQCDELENCSTMLKNLEKAKERDSFISYQPLSDNLTFIKEKGIEAFVKMENETISFLKVLIKQYDDGRSRSFLCLSCQLLPIDKLKDIVDTNFNVIPQEYNIKNKTKALKAAINELVEMLGVRLELRR